MRDRKEPVRTSSFAKTDMNLFSRYPLINYLNLDEENENEDIEEEEHEEEGDDDCFGDDVFNSLAGLSI